MIPNNSIYEAGFKNQFLTGVVISVSLFFATWSLARLIISLSKEEENKKKFNIFYQKCIDLINYYLDDLKYIEKGINYLLKFRHKQVYESIAVEDGLLITCTKKSTIYCDEYYKKVIEKQKANEEKFSEVTICLTLCNGVTLDYMPKYPWYWDGVELFNGIHPNEKKNYNHNYLSPEYVPRFNLFMSEDNNNVTMNKCILNKTENVKTDQEAINIEQNISTSSSASDEEKKLTTLMLTKTLSNPTSVDEGCNDENNIIIYQNQNQTFIYNENDSSNSNNKIEISFKKEMKEELHCPISIYEPKQNDDILTTLKIKSTEDHKTQLKMNIYEEKKPLPSSSKQSKLLPNFKQNKNSKKQQKQKYIKKLKHKKQPKIIYPSIPVNPDLSFTPLYKKDLKESKLNSRVKHEDMETIYKKLKIEICQKSKNIVN